MPRSTKGLIFAKVRKGRGEGCLCLSHPETMSSGRAEQHHSRNESIYSMDSFVADFPREEESEDNSKIFPNYLSPSSRSNTSSGGADASDGQDISAEPVRQTINNVSSKSLSRMDSSDGGSDSVPPIAPAHPFFSAGYYDDSDHSDGSLVFNAPPPSPSALPGASAPKTGKQSSSKREPTARNRLASFDSAGSSGSIRYLPGGSQKMPPQPPPASAQPNLLNINPQMLPYHERRKLMQQRQKQKQTSTPQRPEPTPPRPDRPMPYMMPPQPADIQYYQPGPMQQQPYPGMHMPPPPPGNFPYYPPQGMSPQGMPPQGMPPQGMPPQGMPPQGMPPQGMAPQGMSPQGMPMGMYPPPQGMPMGQYPPYPMQPPGYPQPPQLGPRLSPYRTTGKTEQSSRPHPNTKASPRSRGHQPQVLPSSSLPPSGIQRPLSNINSVSRTSNLSFDSTATPEKDAGQPLPQRRSKDVPPPPPPLPPNYAHVRSDSTGSVSSLGSVVNTEGEDDRQDKKKQDPRPGKTKGSEGFFQRMNPWSPKKPTVKDFHQKSQAFLKRHDRQNSSTPPMSPRSQQLRYVLFSCCLRRVVSLGYVPTFILPT
jgi:hypothetical protein